MAAGNVSASPGLLFLDEILSQEPNRVTEASGLRRARSFIILFLAQVFRISRDRAFVVLSLFPRALCLYQSIDLLVGFLQVRLYAPLNQGAGEHEHEEEGQATGSALDLFTAGNIDTPGRTDRGYYSDRGVGSPHPIYKHVLNVRASADIRRITSDFDLLGSPSTEPGDGVASLQIRCSLASEQQGAQHRRPGPGSPEMGWPVHPLMDLPVVVDTEGTREDVEGQIEGQARRCTGTLSPVSSPWLTSILLPKLTLVWLQTSKVNPPVSLFASDGTALGYDCDGLGPRQEQRK